MGCFTLPGASGLQQPKRNVYWHKRDSGIHHDIFTSVILKQHVKLFLLLSMWRIIVFKPTVRPARDLQLQETPSVHRLPSYPPQGDNQTCEISSASPTDANRFLNRSDPREREGGTWVQVVDHFAAHPPAGPGAEGRFEPERSDEWIHYRPGPLPDEQRNLSPTKRFRSAPREREAVPYLHRKPCCCGSAGSLNTSAQQQLPTCASGSFRLAQPEPGIQLCLGAQISVWVLSGEVSTADK